MDIAAQSNLPGGVVVVLILAILICVLALAIGITINVCIVWLVSKIVTPAMGTFRNAWRYFGYQFLFGLVVVVAMVILLILAFYISNTSGPKSGAFFGFLIISVVFLSIACIVISLLITIEGANSGEVTLSPGTLVKLISVEGDQARIQYMDSVATIPLRLTDYGQTQPPAAIPARTP